MKLDAHRHYWRYNAQEYSWITDALAAFKRDFLPEDAAELDKALALDGVIAVQARSSERENDFLLTLAQQSLARDSIVQTAPIMGIVGWVDLCAAAVGERLDVYRAQPLIRGFRHLVQDEANPSAFWAQADFNRGLRALQQRGFVYDVLVKQADLAAAVAFCARHDQALLMLDHLGKPQFPNGRQDLRQDFPAWYRQMQELAQMPHVGVKISGLLLEAGAGSTWETVKPYVESALTLFGAARCMLGSDDPVCLLSHRRGEVLEFWHSALAGLSAAEQNALSGETAARWYGIGGLGD